MEGHIIIYCGYEGIEKIIGLFTEEEAVERMRRFRKAEFETTHYRPLPNDWDVLERSQRDYENEPHFQTMEQWTTEDRLQADFDNELRRAREGSVTRKDFPDMSEEEFQHQVYLRSREFRFKRFTDRFCVQKIDASGSDCVCGKLGVPASEYVLY